MSKLVKSGIAFKELDDAGSGLARIATLSDVDSDGDTYAPGAFGEQRVKVLAAHDWTTVPIGKARVYEDGDEALAEFQLNLDSATAREWHAALKFDMADGRPLQEWSYGFRVLDAAFEERSGERVRILKRLKVHEISPVVIGAGVGTATLRLKHGRPFREHAAAVIEAVADLAERAREVADLRAKSGRTISAERREQLDEVRNALAGLAAAGAEIDVLLKEGRADPATAGRQAAAFERIRVERNLRR